METEGQQPVGGSGRPIQRDRARDTRLIAAGVVAALLIWFAAINTQKVPIHFWVVTTQASLISVIIVSALLGIILASLVRYQRRKARTRRSG